MREEFLWVEKYRPKTIDETILPVELKKVFQQFVEQKNIPNLILSGSAGVGKTTVARAMLEQLECDYIIINGSNEGRMIDTLRNEITNFASSVSFTGGRKYVILDEADYMNAQTIQPALRNFIEEFSNNCGFIMTCNYKSRIIEPLHSRCSVIDFKISKKDTAKLAGQFFKRVKDILNKENVEFDESVVAEVIKKHFPDWRRVLNELQRYSAIGKIDTGILSNFQDVGINEVLGYMKDKNFTAVRKWCAESVENTDDVFRKLYDVCADHFTPASIPSLILAIAEYQYKAAFVSDHEVNLAACMAEIMTSCDFKS
jgi:DNA polymerase III delta prime subunit